MEDRIRFITHKGRPILLVDGSNCTAEQIAELARVTRTYVTAEPHGSVLLLADFTGSKVDKAALEVIKQTTVLDRPHLKRSAWVGMETVPIVFYENVKAFSQRDLPTFASREEALDWLVAEEKIASGQ